MKKKKKKSGGKRQCETLREIRIIWFGGICMNKDCGEDNPRVLELAHAVPTELSMQKPNGFRSSYERLKDVIENPECFLLFCRKCHNEFDNRSADRTWKRIVVRA